MKVKSISLKNNSSVFTVLKGAFNALIVSLISILIFAFIIKFVSIGDGLIRPVNQIIKIASILFGCFLAFKKNNEKTLFKGLLIGVIYTILAFVLFSLLNGQFVFNKSLVLDILFGGAVGLISSIICNIFIKK